MSNYSIPLPCGCTVNAYDGSHTRGYTFELDPCSLHGAALEMLSVLKLFLKQDRVQRATQQTDIGLATAADRANAVIWRVEGK